VNKVKYQIFYADTILPGDGSERKNSAIIVSGHHILNVCDQDDDVLQHIIEQHKPDCIDFEDSIIVPGFIDIHTHGAMGIDFISASQSNLEITATHFALEGVTSFLTTMMVVPKEQQQSILTQYGKCSSPAKARWLGIHCEGPHLNKKFSAVMNPEYLRPVDLEELHDNLEASQGKLKMITIAPELENAQSYIEACIQRGITVMGGHSDASSHQTALALEWGLDGFTHLYNAMSAHQHRDPGMVTAALLAQRAFSELIVDGFHIAPDVIKLTYRILGPERIILVTDGMPNKGLPEGEILLGDAICVVKDKKATVKATGRLAGSVMGMDDAFRNIMEFTGCSAADAVMMCSVNPSLCLKVEDKIGSLHHGKMADFVVMNKNYQVKATYLEGILTYSKD